MRNTTHGDHLVQLTRYWMFNCFLVREDDGLTLVDTGLGGSAPAILDAARALGAPIRRILITHAHVDHVGSLDALHAQLPDAEVGISARDARFLAGDRSLDPDEPAIPLAGGYQTCTTTPTRLLAAGERIGSLEVVASPGHTPGHLAFLDTRDGTLIAGDAFSAFGGVLTGGAFRLWFPFQAMATWHKRLSLQSAEALAALKPSRLAVGHGRVVDNPVPAMQRAIAEARRRLGSRDHAAQKAY
ncbi:MAG: MBL fold metallo-hydrolase [Anaerolineae bacterium]|nr:MBL fold metallo-hydrolase [Anaerolineae bacterium]